MGLEDGAVTTLSAGLERFGGRAVDRGRRIAEEAGELALLAAHSLRALVTPPWETSAWLAQMEQVGVRSFGVAAITTIFTGMVLALQTALALPGLGVKYYIGTVVSKSTVRELVPVLVALIVGGRIGAGMTAEIGTMKVTEQIDALVTLSTHPMKYLTVPRVLAATLAVPVLVAVGDSIGIFGGYLVGVNRLGFNPATYLKNTREFLEWSDIASGLWKGAAFGFIVALMGCFYGMHSGRGAQGVGRATKSAVVAASVLILATNYILTEVFFSA